MLIDGQEHVRLRVFIQSLIAPVFGDADDFHQRRALREAKAFPQRIPGATIKPAGEFLIYDHDWRRVGRIAVCEIAPQYQPCLHGVEILRRHKTAFGAEALIGGGLISPSFTIGPREGGLSRSGNSVASEAIRTPCCSSTRRWSSL